MVTCNMLLATNHNLVTKDQVHRPSVSPVKNPKIQNLVNEILNDSAIVENNSRSIPIRQESTREKSNISKAIKNPPVPTPQDLPKDLFWYWIVYLYITVIYVPTLFRQHSDFQYIHQIIIPISKFHVQIEPPRRV